MANTAKISLKGDILCVESSDLLKKAKDTRSDKLIKIMAYQIRTEINLLAVKLSVEQKTTTMRAAQKEADQFEDGLLKQIKELLQELERLQQEDKRGNDKAGDMAEKKTKSVSDEIDDSLPEFGHAIRKAVEKALKMKLAANVKSSSTGGFRGIKLTGKFEHGGASAEVVKNYQDAAKSLDQAGDQAMTKSKEDQKGIDALKQTLKDQLASVAKINAKDDDAETAKLVGDIPKTARALGKEFDGYVDKVELFQDHLAKTAKALDVEARELSKDLSTPEFRAKKDKFEHCRKELVALQGTVEKRIKAAKYVVDEFKEAERDKTGRNWQLRLAAINAQVTRFDAINAEPFNKATEQMLIESKKKA